MSVRYWAYRDACKNHGDICYSARGCDNCYYSEELFEEEEDEEDEETVNEK